MESRRAVSRLAAGAGLALLVAAALTHVACGNSSSSNSGFEPGGTENPPLPDGGIILSDSGPPSGADTGTSGPTFDASSSDGGGGHADAGFVPPTVSTDILAVHASANLYDFRLCFGESLYPATPTVVSVPPYPDDPADPMPETNYPGVPVGGASLLRSVPLYSGYVTVYVVRAQALQERGVVSTSAEEPTCDRLICTGGSCLAPQFDYFALPATYLPAAGGTLVLAIEGCTSAGVSPGSVARCGGDWDSSSGNLSAAFGSLAPTPSPAPDAGALVLQIAQMSRSAGQGTVTYVDPSSDASVLLATSGDVSSLGAPQVVPLSTTGVPASFFSLTTDGGALSESLSAIQFFEQPAADPRTWFAANATWFVAVVGDATDAAAPLALPDGGANPAFDGHGLHLIAYPER